MNVGLKMERGSVDILLPQIILKSRICSLIEDEWVKMGRSANLHNQIKSDSDNSHLQQKDTWKAQEGDIALILLVKVLKQKGNKDESKLRKRKRLW